MNKSKISELQFSRFIIFFPMHVRRSKESLVTEQLSVDKLLLLYRKEEFSNRSLECKLRKKVINYILQKSGLDFDIFPHTL